MAFDRNGSAMGRQVSSRDLCSPCFWPSAFAAGPAAAQGVVKGKYGDWEMRCETPPGAPRDQCALMQSVAAEDKPNVNLVVIVLKTADGKSRLLRVIAPLGVLLPSGLGLKIDQTDIGRAGFVRCLPSGCIAEVVMEDKLLDQIARPDHRDLHHFPDAGGRHRHSAGAQRLQGRFRKAALTGAEEAGAANRPRSGGASGRNLPEGALTSELEEAPARTPLYARHIALGGRMVEFAGYDLPVHYSKGVLAEHLFTRAKAGLFDVSHMGQAFPVGPRRGAQAREPGAGRPARRSRRAASATRNSPTSRAAFSTT